MDNNITSIWPWSDLISYVNRYVILKKKKIVVLELGCGAGANIPFFLDRNFKYYGIDKNETMINKIKKKFPEIKDNLATCNFTEQIPFEENFDIIIDRASLTHNSTKEIKRCLKIVFPKMKKNAIFIGIDWYSTNHSDYSNFANKIDMYSRTGCSIGQFKNSDLVHFSNKKGIQKLFSEFEILVLEHKVIIKKIPLKNKFASWNFVAKKN